MLRGSRKACSADKLANGKEPKEARRGCAIAIAIMGRRPLFSCMGLSFEERFGNVALRTAPRGGPAGQRARDETFTKQVRSSTVPHGPSCDPSLHAHSALLSRCSRGRAARCLHCEPSPPQVHRPHRSTPYSTHLDPSMHRYPPTLGLRCSHLFTSPSAVRPGVIAVSQTVRSKLLDGYAVYLWTPRGRSTSTAGDAAVGLSHSVTRARAPRCELAHAPRWVHPRRSAEARPPPCTARRRGVPEGFRITKGSG